jgi:hypothetical protein
MSTRKHISTETAIVTFYNPGANNLPDSETQRLADACATHAKMSRCTEYRIDVRQSDAGLIYQVTAFRGARDFYLCPSGPAESVAGVVETY